MKLKYKIGDKVGECSFAGNERTEFVSNRKRRVGLFSCPHCGNEFDALIDNVKRNVTRSCGCLQKKVSSLVHKTHGMSGSDEYSVWLGVKTRCNDINDMDYGGRGIRICSRWEDSFENFYADMGDRPSKHHTIERKKNHIGYQPDNCVWATTKEQALNKRNNKLVTYNNETKPLMEWARQLNAPYSTLQKRIANNWDINDVFNISFDGKNKFKRIKKLKTW